MGFREKNTEWEILELILLYLDIFFLDLSPTH